MCYVYTHHYINIYIFVFIYHYITILLLDNYYMITDIYFMALATYLPSHPGGNRVTENLFDSDSARVKAGGNLALVTNKARKCGERKHDEQSATPSMLDIGLSLLSMHSARSAMQEFRLPAVP